MATWAYIATTAGAPMSNTLALAEGTAPKRVTKDQDGSKKKRVPGENPGLIHRSHYYKDKVTDKIEDTPQINDIQIGHEIVLMYDFMDTGLVYPLARFKILDPKMEINQAPLENMELNPQPYEGSPPLIVLQRGDRLQPDYIGNIDIGSEGNQERHLALIVQQISAGPPSDAVGKVFLRDPKKKHNTILPWEKVKLANEYDEKFKDTEERKEQLNPLVPVDISNELKNKLDTLWGGNLDGRSKQLLINTMRLHKVSPGSVYNDFSNSTLSGYCLIALVEYEMLRLLKKMADIKLTLSGEDPWIADDLRFGTGRGYSTRLPLAPEGVDDDCNFRQQMYAIRFIAGSKSRKKLIVPISQGMTIGQWQGKWDKACHPIQRARNRIAHSYYLQKVHFNELWKLVCGKDGILKLLHG
jgi:hypothetical protein